MKRRLSKEVTWDEASLELELLDWENDPGDFQRLVNHVAEVLEKEYAAKAGGELWSLFTREEFEGEVRVAARGFQEKYLSLPFFVYMSLKCRLIWKHRRLKKPPPS